MGAETPANSNTEIQTKNKQMIDNHLEDQELSQEEIKNITANIQKEDFCENFADILKQNEQKIIDAITQCLDKDIGIGILSDLLSSLNQKSSDEYIDLKQTIQDKITQENKKIDENTTNNTFPNPDILSDLQTQVDKIYQENGIEKEDEQKILDYITANKDNPAFITFMDGLIQKNKNIGNTDGIHITVDKRDGYIGSVEDFAKKVESIGLPKLDLKPKEKTVDNTTNTGTTNTVPQSIDFTKELPKLKSQIETGFNDGTLFILFAKDSETINKAIQNHKEYNNIKTAIDNIKDIKDIRNIAKQCMLINGDLLNDANVTADIEAQLKKDPNNKITIDNVKQNYSYMAAAFQNLDKSIQSMTPDQLEEAIKNNTLGKELDFKVKDISTQDYNFTLLTEINDTKTNNQELIKLGQELIKNLTSAKTQGETNTIVDNFIKTGDANNDIKDDPNRSKLKTALQKNQYIPKEDVELIINSIQKGDLDFVTAKIDLSKKKTEAQEKLDKEKGTKDLSEFLKTSIDANLKPDDIAKLAKPLFETDPNRFNALCDRLATNPKDNDKQLGQNQQQNLRKYIAAYMGLKEGDFTIDSLNVETSDGKGTYKFGTKIIKIDGYVDRHIVFGTFDQVQKDKADHFEQSGGKAKIIEHLTKGENKDAIIGLADTGSYKVFETIIKDNPNLLQTILKSGFLTQLMDANTLLINNKPKEAGKASTQDILKLQLADQQKGYIEVIRDNVLNEIRTNGNVDPFKRSDPNNKEPATEKARASRGLFHEYLAQVKSNPSYLGNDLNAKIGSFNAISTTYINYRNKNQAYFTLLQGMSEDDINTNPQKRIDKETREMFSVINKNVGTEVNKEYGTVATLQKLFAEFKDEIVMVLEFLGFDKESVLHRCGGNEALKKSINEAYNKAFKLESKDKEIINDIHTKGAIFDELKKTEKYDSSADNTTQNILDRFRTGQIPTKGDNDTVDFKKAYITYFETKDGSNEQVDGNFLRSVIDSYNKNNPDQKLNADDYLTGDNKAKKGWTTVLDKAWNDKFIRETIANNSEALQNMALDNKAKRKSTESQFKEAASYTIQNLGANPMEAVSYYLSTMILAGSKDLKYKISENNAAEPVVAKTPEAPKNSEQKELLSKTLGIKADFIDTNKTTETKITLDKDANPVSINAIFDKFADAPVGLKIDGKNYSKKGETYVDEKNTPVKIKEGTTIESMEDDRLADLIVSNTIDAVSKIDKTTINAPKENYDKTANKDYGDKVIKPIFDLFSAENTYKSLVKNTTINQAIKDPNTLKFMLQYSTKDNSIAGSAEEIHSKAATDIIAKIQSDSKVSFKQNTEKTAIVAVIKGKDDKVTAEREIGQGFTLKDVSEKSKTPEKTPTGVDYTSIEAFRKSLGYTTEIPKDYDTKLETEFLKDRLTQQQQEVIAKEIARINIKLNNEMQANKGNTFDFKNIPINAALRDGVVTNNGKLKGDARKVDDNTIKIEITGGKTNPFTVNGSPTELLS